MDAHDGATSSTLSREEWDGTRRSVRNIVSLDTSRPLSSFINLLRFLASTNIQILEHSDIDRPQTEQVGKRGSSMEVFHGIYNDKPVALKYFRWPRLDSLQPHEAQEVVEKYQQSMYDLLFELKVMTHEPLCHHRNLVRSFGLTFDPKVSDILDPSLTDLVNPIVVVELADPRFTDLAGLFQVAPTSIFTFDMLANLISDIADGIAILHEYGIVHSDIKPRNILIFAEGDNLVAKIGDFGAAGLEATTDKPRGFTRYWAAPECLDDCVDEYPLPELRMMRFGKAHDVYSFGLVVGFIMLLGQHPLPDINGDGELPSYFKFDDVADDAIYAMISGFWDDQDKSTPEDARVRDNLELIHDILEETLRLFPNARMVQLNDIRQRLLGSDPFASDKYKHRFVRRHFTEREQSLIGKARKEDAYDTFDIEPKYSVYPNLPDFLLPFLQRAGLADSPSTKYFPRGFLGDQPVLALGDKEDAQAGKRNAFEEELHAAIRKRWERLEGRQDSDSREAVALSEDAQSDDSGCEIFRLVTGFEGTLREYASFLMKMQIWPHLYPEGAYNSLRKVMVDEFDPAIFNIRDPRFNNKTIFHASCWCRDLETARFLLQHGADINAVDDAGMTPWLQTFLEPFTFFRGTVPDMKDEKDIPADMIIEIAQFLVSQGARLDFEVKDCPLLNRLEVMHYNANKPKLIDFLVRHGHPVDNYHPSFGTPLFCAAINRNVKSVKRLLRLGANPNIMVPGEKGDYDHLEPAIAKVMRDSHSTALVEAVAQDCVTIRSNLSGLETFELLLKHGATVYPRLGQIGWHDGSPMAHVFILRNRNDYLEVLLRYHSGFVLSRNAGGHTPLQVAAMARNLQAVQLLIDHGADLNARSFDGCTALLSAFGYRNDLEIEEQDSPEWREESLEIANILGANGADITARRSWRFAPPTRVFLDCDPEDVARSCAFTVSDDSLVNNWKMWIIRRNLEDELATCGSALFLRPSIISGGFNLELTIPVLGNNQSPPMQGLYRLNARLGVLKCRHNTFSIAFSLCIGKQDQKPDIKTIGVVEAKRLRPNHVCEVAFEHPILIKDDPYIIFVFLMAEDGDSGGAVAGLFLDWVELSPISGDDRKPAMEADRKWPIMCTVEKSSPISEFVPHGIWEAMSQEPSVQQDNGGAPQYLGPLDMLTFAPMELPETNRFVH